MIILLRQMSQNEERSSTIIVRCEEFRESVIGQMANARHDPLLDRPGIWTDTKHFEIVVGFDNEAVATAQVVANVTRHESEIGGVGDAHAFGDEAETDGVSGIVRNGEGHDLYVSDNKVPAG